MEFFPPYNGNRSNHVLSGLVIGLGVSGRAAAALLLEKGFSVVAVDRRFESLQQDPQILPLIAKGLKVCSDQEPFASNLFSIAVLSPGFQHSHPLVQQMKKEGVELLSEVELAFRYLPNDVILGVTGTNGKTTTVLLIAHILNAAGKKARALGNIGAALCDYVGDREEILVVELSSFQLHTLLPRPYFNAALILNISPNHLNWHASMEEYAAAKLKLKDCLKPGGKLFVSKKVHQDYQVGMVFDEKPRGAKPDLRLQAAAWENIQAACAICSLFEISKEQVQLSLKNFCKPPHRIEWVAEIDGVHYYNDSKASNVGAVLHAVALFDGPIILICGGVDKGSSYAPWIESFRRKVKKMVVYGEAAEKMERELKDEIPVERVLLMQDAFCIAARFAAPADIVLLSPGAASYDQFANFERRGDAFKKMVGDLWTEKKS